MNFLSDYRREIANDRTTSKLPAGELELFAQGRCPRGARIIVRDSASRLHRRHWTILKIPWRRRRRLLPSASRLAKVSSGLSFRSGLGSLLQLRDPIVHQ